MARFVRWCRRLTVAGAAALTVLVVPAIAWADPGDLDRRRPGLGVSGLLGACCCLSVLLIVLGIALFIQRLRRRPRQD